MERMRRVVVTGLGMVTPLGLRRRGDLAPAPGRRVGCGQGREFRRLGPALPDRRAGAARRGAGRLQSRRLDGAKEQRRVDDFIIYAMSAATQALRDADWAPKTYEEEIETGVLIGSGIGGLGGIYDASDHPAREGPAPHLAVLHSGPADQSGRRTGVDRPQAQGPQPCGRDRLLDRRARHRRRGRG